MTPSLVTVQSEAGAEVYSARAWDVDEAGHLSVIGDEGAVATYHRSAWSSVQCGKVGDLVELVMDVVDEHMRTRQVNHLHVKNLAGFRADLDRAIRRSDPPAP